MIRRVVIHTLALALCLLALRPVSAQPATPASPRRATVADLVAQLDDADYATRLRATQALLGDDSLDARTLVQYCNKSVSAEQRHRLLDITLHHVVAEYVKNLPADNDPESNVGAIGTLLLPALTAAHMPDLNTSAVRIGQPRAGFPAYARLLPGDLVVAFGDKTFPRNGEPEQILLRLTESIKASPQGKDIRLTVYRDGATFPLDVRVGSLSALRLTYNDVNPRTGLPRPWDVFAAQNNLNTAPSNSPPPIDLNPLLQAVPNQPAAPSQARNLKINRPPKRIRPRNPNHPAGPDDEDENAPAMRE